MSNIVNFPQQGSLAVEVKPRKRNSHHARWYNQFKEGKLSSDDAIAKLARSAKKATDEGFERGSLIMTPTINAGLDMQELQWDRLVCCYMFYSAKYWGDGDWSACDWALENGDAILASYSLPEVNFVITTSPNRDITMFMTKADVEHHL